MKTGCCTSGKMMKSHNNVICMNQECSNYLGQTRAVRNLSAWKIPVALSLFSLRLFLPATEFSAEQANAGLLDFKHPAEITIPLSAQNLKLEIQCADLLCPDEVYAQMLLESAHLKSDLTVKANNLMGMRYPFSRKTTAIGIYLGKTGEIIIGDKSELKKYAKESHYAVYASWQDAVADYKLWQESVFRVKEKYLAFLGNVYAEDSLYVNKIQKMVKKVN